MHLVLDLYSDNNILYVEIDNFFNKFYEFRISQNGYFHSKLNIDFVYDHNTFSIHSRGEKVVTVLRTSAELVMEANS